jgi:membrane protein required for beta-lactamase induction
LKRFLVGSALLAALLVYAAVVLWLVLTGIPQQMMAGALLAAAPLVVAAHQSLRSAAVERERIATELRELRDEIRRERDAVL